jgi:phospholipid/cholesterol/gamma-HCH transport system substrate-binding protein
MGLAIDDDRLTRRVGSAVLLLALAAIGLVLGLDSIHLRAGVHVEVFFTHLGGLKEGADVQVAGRVIGEVKNVGLLPAGRTGADHPLAGAEGIAVAVRIEQRYAYLAPRNGEFFITSKGVLGERFLEVGAPRDPRTRELIEPDRPVTDGDQIRGVDPAQMDRVLWRSYANLVMTEVFLDQLRPEGRKLRQAVERVAETLAEIEPEPGAYRALGRALTALQERATSVESKLRAMGVDLDDLSAITARVRANTTLTRAELDEIDARIAVLADELERIDAAVPRDLAARLEGLARTARGSIERLRAIETTSRELWATIERGEGNLGGLLHDPEFSDNAKEIGKALKREPWRTIGHPQDTE